MGNIKVLNLYAGIGGSRKLWQNVDVTAVENNKKISDIYQQLFPNDKVIVTDAHQYLLKHFSEYDFIWSSPPCPTHSKIRRNTAVERGQNEPIYPDMRLYQEILFLQGYFKGKWVVENVISWYEPLIKPQEVNKHYFWSNFKISSMLEKRREHDSGIEILQQRKGIDLTSINTNGLDKREILRNCVEPETGKEILECALREKQLALSSHLSDEVSTRHKKRVDVLGLPQVQRNWTRRGRAKSQARDKE